LKQRLGGGADDDGDIIPSKCVQQTIGARRCARTTPTNHFTLLRAIQCSDGSAGKLLMRWRTYCI
jgi:hypothetical protein